MCLSMNKNSEISVDKYLEARPNNKADDVEGEKVVISDFLADVTQQTRKAFKLLMAGSERFKESVFYKTLTGTTQPAHVAAILIVLVISYSLWPELQNKHEGQGESASIKFFYFGSFAIHLGAQIWMTFVSGLALYFSLPRHTFGRCQQILFPKYFLMNTFLSGTTLVTFAKINANINDTRWLVQLIVLSICVIIEMTIYFYLTPAMIKLMEAKYKFERAAHNGQEIGYQQEVDGLKTSRYQQIHKKFRKIHMTVAIGNVIAIGCSFAHLYYLASRITIL